MAQSNRQVHGLLARIGKPEQEFSVPWITRTTAKSPSSIKTDKIICALLFHWRGRIVIANAAIAALTVDSLGELLQEVRVYGTHAQFGSQRPIVLRGKQIRALDRIYRIGYVPRDLAAAGNTGLWPSITNTAVAGTYDLDVFWTLPLYPMPIALSLAPLYSLKGPDWAGNLYVEFDCCDATAFGGVVANTTITAYGSGQGNPTVYVSVIRPNLTVDLMNRISPAICFKSHRALDSVVQGASFAAQKLADLNIGKGFCSAVVESGTLFATLGTGQRGYAAMSDAIVTRTFIALDGKPLVNPYDGPSEQEWDGFLGGNVLPVGYNVQNFIRESQNPDAAFPAQTLTSARRFEIDADMTGAAAQGCELIQEEVLGSPSIAQA